MRRYRQRPARQRLPGAQSLSASQQPSTRTQLPLSQRPQAPNPHCASLVHIGAAAGAAATGAAGAGAAALLFLAGAEQATVSAAAAASRKADMACEGFMR